LFEETVREDQKSERLFLGLMFTVVGVAFAWGATTYTVGNGARMGPGYFPLMLGILLALIGLFMSSTAGLVETEDGEKIGKWAWKPLGYIIAPTSLFGVLLGGLPKLGVPAMGLIIAIYALDLHREPGRRTSSRPKEGHPRHRPGRGQLPRLHLCC
jgi:hypothetical protein